MKDDIETKRRESKKKGRTMNLVVSTNRGSPRERVIDVAARCTDPSLSTNERSLLAR